ncbi:MAG: c-type cytochrome [Sutterellaceae bacterium]|nr:c-type cytochrome [Burkholderiaceae bacterium]MDW8429894.1 c-type cytochrome [Sutterellaceae bacterium]
MKRKWLLGAALWTVCATAQPQMISGPGAALTQARCSVCHEPQHFLRSRLSRGEWEDVIDFMIKRGMPPLTKEEHTIIVNYLATYYGRDPAPPPAPDTYASADPIETLLTKHACTGCHAVDRKLIGPSFREVAARYATDGGAATRLAAKIRNGGVGVWGNVPMPATAGLSESDAAKLAQWVLGQK